MGGRRDDASRACPTCSTSAASASPPRSISPRMPEQLGQRAYDAMEHAFHEEGMMIRVAGDTIALTPPLIVSEKRDRGDIRQGGAGDQGGGVEGSRPRRLQFPQAGPIEC